MKNLKRVLSLALSGIMLVGMMAVAASAVDYKDFTDKDEITHTEAVSTMNLLGVIAGKDTGAFDPKGTVTRAEMAKMITVALNGGKDPILGTKSTPTYSDIKGHWAEQYIEYCSSLNIIAGQGDGTFAPDATVTGTQAAKMMLTAMGYEAEVYNLVGPDWEINTSREANTAGLFDELDDMNPGEGMSRDNAAQLIWNGVQAKTLTKTPSQSITTGEITFRYDLNGPSMLADKFKVYTSIGQMTAVDEGNLTLVDDPDWDNDESYPGASAIYGWTKVSADNSAYLGQTVKVLYKASDNVVGVAVVDGNKTYETAMSAIESADSGNKVKFGGTTYTLDYAEDGTHKVRVLTIKADGTLGDVATGTAASLIDGTNKLFHTVTLVDNDNDGKIEYAVIRENVAGKVTYKSNTDVIVAGTTYKLADNDVDEKVEKNGFAVVTADLFNDAYVITALEKNTATASANSGATKFRMDGEWYFKGNTTLAAADAGKEIDFYAFNGILVDAKAPNTTSADDIVMVLKTDLITAINPQAVMLLSDGTKQTVKLDDSTTAPTPGALYTYESSDDGYEFTAAATFGSGSSAYTWTAPAADDLRDSDDDAAADGTKNVASINGAAPIADTAVVFVYNGAGDGKVITGKQLKNVKVNATAAAGEVGNDTKGFYTSTIDGLSRVVVVGVQSHSTMPTVGSDSKLYGLIVDSAIKLDNDYIEYKIWTGDAMETVKEKKVSALATRTQFSVIKYSSIDGDVIKDVDDSLTDTAAPAGASTANTLYVAPVISLSGDKLWPNSSNAAGDLDNDTVYMYYDSSKTKAEEIGMAGGELTVADKAMDDTTPIANVKYVVDGDGDVAFCLVDVKNKVQDAKAKAVLDLSRGTSVSTANTTSVAIDKSTAIVGDSATLTFTIATASSETITLTNAVFGDGTTTLALTGLVAGNYSYTIYPTATGYLATAA